MPTISFDFSFLIQFWNELSSGSPFNAAWILFKSGGWIVVVIMIFYGAWILYMKTIQINWFSKQKYILLSIDVPKNNEQSPKAVENIFAHFYGIKSSIDWKEKYIKGKFQTPFTLEIVSLGGDVRFFIHTPLKYKNLVEAAIYSQYPDAFVSEAEDYTTKFPKHFPNDKYEIFGCDFKLDKEDMYPLRTYPMFEHTLSGEFLDPMSLILETMSNIDKEEFLCLQIICAPEGDGWRNSRNKKLQALLGKPVKAKKGIFGYVGDFLSDIVIHGFVGGAGEGQKDKKNDDAFKMLAMSPGERRVIEGVEMKLSKVGFPAKVRWIQLAPHEKFVSKYSNVKGFLRQFAALNSNALGSVLKTMPRSNFFYQRMAKPGKQTRLTNAYRHRDPTVGGPMYVLNIEELATLWHFPMLTVKAPMVKKTDAKRGEPPRGLPIR